MRWAKNTSRFASHFFSGKNTSEDQADRPRVILLCGWGLTSGTMSILARRLELDGFLVDIFDLGVLNTRSVYEQARRLSEHLMETTSDNKKVALIGHSLGGIIGRYAVSAMGGSRNVHTLITLGSPHRGSPMAKAALYTPFRWTSGSVEQLTPDSKFIRELGETPIPADVYCASLFSESDAFCPRPYAEIELIPGDDHVTNIDIGSYGHFEFVVDENIYDRIKNELTVGILRQNNPPTAVD